MIEIVYLGILEIRVMASKGETLEGVAIGDMEFSSRSYMVANLCHGLPKAMSRRGSEPSGRLDAY
jgi:hypothetical protein